MVGVELNECCPFLAKTAESNSQDLDITIDPSIQVDATSFCPVGEKIVDAEITSDLYTARKMVSIEITCKGCTSLQEGFKTTVRRKVR